jgi:hypothetical protein
MRRRSRGRCRPDDLPAFPIGVSPAVADLVLGGPLVLPVGREAGVDGAARGGHGLKPPESMIAALSAAAISRAMVRTRLAIPGGARCASAVMVHDRAGRDLFATLEPDHLDPPNGLWLRAARRPVGDDKVCRTSRGEHVLATLRPGSGPGREAHLARPADHSGSSGWRRSTICRPTRSSAHSSASSATTVHA